MRFDKTSKISCFIIGGGTLPINCAEILLSAGHEIRGIATFDSQLRNWAKKNNINHFLPGANLAEQIREPFDYLFSIVNENILREDILGQARRSAINYHDAPLPRYAGTHATSWALMNGETMHGISWHLITETVDAGDILKQAQVEISPNDTAFSLNTKCYEAAIDAFRELVEDLSRAKAVARKQNLEERTFFARFKRPANGGIISWNKNAAEISALVRALNFGNHPNRLGTAKFAVENEFFIVSELEILETASASAPGTINRIGRDFLQISTLDREVILKGVLRLDGQPVAIADLTEKFNFQKGYRFRDAGEETVRRIETLYKTNCKHEAFWVERLSDLKPAAAPFAHTAAAADSANYENAPVSFPPEVSKFLENSPPERTNRFILAAFGAFLARLNGIESFEIGYSDAETQSETAGSEKLFAGQVPLRFNIDCLQNFARLSEDLEKELESVKSHKTFAHDVVARYPQLRSASESGEKFTLPVAAAEAERLVDYQPADGNDLTLVMPKAEKEFHLIYDRNRIERENIERLTGHFGTFLKNIFADHEKPLAEISLLTEAERHRLLVRWNETRADYPKDKCIHHLFESQAARTPDATALIFGENRLTYRRLNRRANRLANYLKRLGVGAETLVGVCLERSDEMLVGVLAVLKAGGAYVPLDPAYPKERRTYMLEDSQAAVLLTQQKLVGELNQNRAQIVCLDTDRDKIAKESDENPVVALEQNNLAYVIYTSGSTGRPKGVAIEHRSAVAFLSWATSVFSAEQLKGVLASTSLCFDLSIYEMFAPLACGGTVILVENILYLPDAPAADEVTLINTVPSAITELLRMKGVPPSVRTVNLAGEPLKPSLVRQIYEIESVKEVFDLYGPSEDTTYSTFTLRDTGRATIGRPISNTQAFILDRFMHPVPVGVAGELYLGGDGLARGYLNRPELTNERFINDPFAAESGARLYKTGDLTRYLPTGEIEYLGRIDNQVKIRGFRIELGEIEARLLTHPAIEEAVVVAREDSPGDKRLAAYYVASQMIQTADLREFLKQKLPDYMIPSAFVELDEMPLTPNGKINRKALPAPSARISGADDHFVAPRNEIEEKLAEIWQKTLNLSPIGVTDDFFKLGGDSLRAVSLFVEIEEAFGRHLPLTVLIESPTIEKMAAHLDAENSAEGLKYLVPLKTGGTAAPLFCMHAAGGNVLFYRDLAGELDADQPVYGLQARGVADKTDTAHDNVSEMAAEYLKEMRTVQPRGPYKLCGSSFGGLIAFEMACQLKAGGEDVALLALFDTYAPGYPKKRPDAFPLESKFRGLFERAGRLRQQIGLIESPREKVEFVGRQIQKLRMRVKRKKAWKKNQFDIAYAKATGGELPVNIRRNHQAIEKAQKTYEPPVFDGEMIIFRAALQPAGVIFEPFLGWKNLTTQEITVKEVPGSHGALTVHPYAGYLAKEVSPFLKQQKVLTGAARAVAV